MRIAFCSIFSNFNRVDKYISKVFNLGRRKVAYLFSEGRVYVNRKKAKKSQGLNERDLIEIEFDDKDFNYSEIKIIKETDEYLIIYKPPKFHSQEIFKNRKSVENFLKIKFGENIKLLNRLDFYSQGFLVASKTLDFYLKYKKLEKDKKIEKYYFTFVKGKMFEKKIINKDIDYKKKKIVKVLENESNTIITQILPIGVYKDFTAIVAKIFKGARHQIRAHLSYIGHPLLGDFLYNEYPENIDFFLFCFGYRCKDLNLNFFEYSILEKSVKNFFKVIL